MYIRNLAPYQIFKNLIAISIKKQIYLLFRCKERVKQTRLKGGCQGRAREFEGGGCYLKPSVFRPKSSEEQKKGQHVRRCPIFRAKVK